MSLRIENDVRAWKKNAPHHLRQITRGWVGSLRRCGGTAVRLGCCCTRPCDLFQGGLVGTEFLLSGREVAGLENVCYDIHGLLSGESAWVVLLHCLFDLRDKFQQRLLVPIAVEVVSHERRPESSREIDGMTGRTFFRIQHLAAPGLVVRV